MKGRRYRMNMFCGTRTTNGNVGMCVVSGVLYIFGISHVATSSEVPRYRRLVREERWPPIHVISSSGVSTTSCTFRKMTSSTCSDDSKKKSVGTWRSDRNSLSQLSPFNHSTLSTSTCQPLHSSVKIHSHC